MFDRQYDPGEITTYEVAREVIGRRIGELLDARDATTDPDERLRLDAARAELVRRRHELQVGSAEATRIVEQATAARLAAGRDPFGDPPRRADEGDAAK